MQHNVSVSELNQEFKSSFGDGLRRWMIHASRRPFPDCLLIVLVALFFFRQTLFNGDYQMGSDALSWYAFQRYTALQGSLYSTWESVSWPGTPGQVIPFNILITFLLSLSGSPASEKALFFMVHVAAGLGMYLLAYHWFKDRNGALVSALLYMTARTVLDDSLQGQWYIVFGMALLPWLVLSWDYMVRRRSFPYIVAAAMVYSLYFGSAHLVFQLISAFFLGPFIAWDTIAAKLEARNVSWRKFLSPLLWFPVVLGLLTAALVVPVVAGRAITARVAFRPFELLVRTIREGSQQSLWETITVDKVSGSFFIPDVPVGSTLLVLFPAFALTALFLRRDRYVAFLGVSAIAFAFLAKGFHPPFGGIYSWFVENIPQFANMRVPSRWLFITVFCFALLAGVTSGVLYDKVRQGVATALLRRRFRGTNPASLGRPIAGVLVAGLVALTVMPQWPMLSFGIKSFQVPPDYLAMYDWLKRQPGDFAVIPLPARGSAGSLDPRDPSQPPGWYSIWEYGSWSPAIHGKTVIGREEWYPPGHYLLEYMTSLFRDAPSQELLKFMAQFNVRYLVVQPHAPKKEVDFFASQPGLTPVYKAAEQATIFENQFWRPHIFASSRYVATVGGPEAFSSVSTVLEVPGAGLAPLAFLYRNTSRFEDLLEGSDTVLFADADIWDLVFAALQAGGKGYVVDAADFVRKEQVAGYDVWVPDDTHTLAGRSVASNSWVHALTTGDLTTLEIPLELSEGDYEIWARVWYGGAPGSLAFDLGEFHEDLRPVATSPYRTFRWTRVGEASLSGQPDSLKITHTRVKKDEPQGNAIDQVAIVASPVLSEQKQLISELLVQKHLVFLVQQNRWQGAGLSLDAQASDGQVMNTLSPISWKLDAPHAGPYRVAIRAAKATVAGDVTVRIEGRQAGVLSLGSGGVPIEATVVSDDGQSRLWKSANPSGQVSVADDSSDKMTGADSLRVDILQTARSAFTLLNFDFPSLQDWRDDRFLTLWVKGTGSGNPLTLSAHFGPNKDGRATWSFSDPVDWQRIVLPLTFGFSQSGGVDWGQVSGLSLAWDTKDVVGSLRLDGFTLYEDLSREGVQDAFTWTYLDVPVELEEGENAISFEPYGPLWLDLAAVYSLKEERDNTALGDLLLNGHEEFAVSVSHRKIEPTLYEVSVKAEGPFFLLLTEAYHPMWKAYVDGNEIDPIPMNNFFNGYFIDKTGEYTIRLEYKAQRYASWGARISLVAWLAVGVYLAFLGVRRWRRSRQDQVGGP